ncbi:unnamed protein product, partial [Rotaria sp. Silwood2]
MYSHINGLSGTLGSESERDFLKITYNVDFITVPVALTSRFKEYQPIVCKTIEEWRKKIVETAMKTVAGKNKRSLIIICETIKDVEQIKQSFKQYAEDEEEEVNKKHNISNTAKPESDSSKLGNVIGTKKRKIAWPTLMGEMQKFDYASSISVYKRSYEKFSYASEGLDAGKIIIATNLAGRGTDIKVSEHLNKKGGLHVLLTYLPENYRIEQQAFGRTARKGQNGSGQLIFLDKNLESDDNGNYDDFNCQLYSVLKVVDVKNERDYDELCRVGEIREYYETSIQFEENLFTRFHKCYDKLKEKLLREWKVQDDIKSVILNS